MYTKGVKSLLIYSMTKLKWFSRKSSGQKENLKWNDCDVLYFT